MLRRIFYTLMTSVRLEQHRLQAPVLVREHQYTREFQLAAIVFVRFDLSGSVELLDARKNTYAKISLYVIGN